MDLISLWVELQFHYDELWIHMANAAATKRWEAWSIISVVKS